MSSRGSMIFFSIQAIFYESHQTYQSRVQDPENYRSRQRRLCQLLYSIVTESELARDRKISSSFSWAVMIVGAVKWPSNNLGPTLLRTLLLTATSTTNRR